MSDIRETERRVEQLLEFLGQTGGLEIDPSGSDFDRLSATHVDIAASAEFREKALDALANAQREREEANPHIALGALVASGRRRLHLEPSALAAKLKLTPTLIEALETGELSVRQVMQGFPVPAIGPLLRTLGIQVQEVVSLLMDAWGTSKNNSRFLSSTVTLREEKDDANLALDVAQYIAELEAEFNNPRSPPTE